MPILPMLANALLTIVSIACTICTWLILIRVVLSLVGVNPFTHYNEILGMIYTATDVLLKPFARLPLRIGMLDLSPMLALMVFQLAPQVLASVLIALLGPVR